MDGVLVPVVVCIRCLVVLSAIHPFNLQRMHTQVAWIVYRLLLGSCCLQRPAEVPALHNLMNAVAGTKSGLHLVNVILRVTQAQFLSGSLRESA